MTRNKLTVLCCAAVMLAIGASGIGWLVSLGDVQDSRRKVTLENCEAQNERNKRTIQELVNNVEALPPIQRRQAQASVPFTITLIDSLAPYRDCNEVLKKANL